ncbi:hypothetical protein [Cystobacter ferrugineus]|uniref:FecR protein domain-containing protein n=1 Tax=Cystobacter ferrugineus TaxID=83449 RepID=A0A1L9BBN3_9BACT|nr:hypothetical protein [Cystobacter ferrugineus]OJH39674.1 hypothetical protein BON30_19535 [Cystobacter ferrugineus]
MIRSSALRVLLSALVLLCLPASATTMLRMDLPELSHSADVIVHGTVRRVESRWSGDRRLIVTDVEIQVTEALKGQAGGTVLVTQSGGQVGDIGQTVSGLASFSPNEEVVVFLERRGSAFHVSGLAQGKYKVLRTEGDTRAMAVPESTGEALLLDSTTRQPVTSSRQALPLPELKTAIRAALQQPAPVRSQGKRP